jgi:hypothetical protein
MTSDHPILDRGIRDWQGNRLLVSPGYSLLSLEALWLSP